jgi:hypothetical protein
LLALFIWKVLQMPRRAKGEHEEEEEDEEKGVSLNSIISKHFSPQ